MPEAKKSKQFQKAVNGSFQSNLDFFTWIDYRLAALDATMLGFSASAESGEVALTPDGFFGIALTIDEIREKVKEFETMLSQESPE